MNSNVLGILALLHKSDDPWTIKSRVKIHCLALHLQEQSDEAPTYSFDGQVDGPRSNTVDNALETAIERDLLVKKELPTFGGGTQERFTLTADGAAVVEQRSDALIVQAAQTVMNQYDYPVSNLVKDTVAEYPRFRAALRW